MTGKLLSETWAAFDSYELRLLLDKHVGGLGQYDGRFENSRRIWLPLAGPSSKIVLTYSGQKIAAIDAGEAFDADEWKRVSTEIENSICNGPIKVGREYSFSSFRVQGSWRGARSGVQILPPPNDAPRAHEEVADHPFILEVPLKTSDYWPLTNHRRTQGHRKLTLLLDVLLKGKMRFQPQRSARFWGSSFHDGAMTPEWMHQHFNADLGPAVIDELSEPSSEAVEVLKPADYYDKIGNDLKALRVPADLDDQICCYLQLSSEARVKFDRAAFWLDVASRQWEISVSASFASLVSVVESMVERGTTHRVFCGECGCDRQHDVPGATEQFRSFFERYAPGPMAASRRTKMYGLRSGILHGSQLMQLDQDIAFGWDPPGLDERELYEDLWGLTRIALRNWLRSFCVTA